MEKLGLVFILLGLESVGESMERRENLIPHVNIYSILKSRP